MDYHTVIDLNSSLTMVMNNSLGMDNSTVVTITAATSALDETFIMYRIVFDIYIVGILCVVGILGNVMSMLVLGKDRTMRRTTAFLLQMVAMADLLYLITCLFIQTLKTILEFTNWMPSLDKHWPYMEPYVWAVASIAQTCTVWLVLLLTTDRYVAICKPLHANQYSTMKRMSKLAIAIWILAVIYNIPRFFERNVVMTFNNETNTTTPEVKKTDMRENIYYFIIYKLVCYLTLRVLIPLSFLAFFNTRLIQAIKDSHRLARILTENLSHSDQPRPRPDKNRHTLTLVVVVIVFVVCETPDVLLRIWVSLNFLKLLPLPPAAKYVNTISNLLLTINSCVNFVIYCLLGAKFRSILVQMFCKRASKRQHDLGRYVTVQNASVNQTQTTNATSEEMTILMNHTTH